MAHFAERTIAYVRDYSDYVGGGRFLPTATPNSLEEEEEALGELLLIESQRTAHLPTTNSNDLILIDRSAHTLLAHCFALEGITGIGYGSLAEDILLRSSVPLWPGTIFYLDITDDAVRERNKGKFGGGSIFVQPKFNAGIRSYFAKLAALGGSTRVIWMDATLSIHSLRELACVEVREFLSKMDGDKESS